MQTMNCFFLKIKGHKFEIYICFAYLGIPTPLEILCINWGEKYLIARIIFFLLQVTRDKIIIAEIYNRNIQKDFSLREIRKASLLTYQIRIKLLYIETKWWHFKTKFDLQNSKFYAVYLGLKALLALDIIWILFF